jgi:hypothetical protein
VSSSDLFTGDYPPWFLSPVLHRVGNDHVYCQVLPAGRELTVELGYPYQVFERMLDGLAIARLFGISGLEFEQLAEELVVFGLRARIVGRSCGLRELVPRR